MLLVRHKELPRAHAIAQGLRQALVEADDQRMCRILGPAPAPLARLRGEYRVQLLVKSRSRKQMRMVIDGAMRTVEENGHDLRSVNLEIDPITMM